MVRKGFERRAAVAATSALLALATTACGAREGGVASAGFGAPDAPLTPAEEEVAWRKTRTSLRPGAETVFAWSGEIYAQESPPQDGAPARPVVGGRTPLFRFEGFNVARVLEAEGHAVVASREAAFYEDPTTGEILRCWSDPWSGRDGTPKVARRVVHVWNDPVTFPLVAPRHDGFGGREAFQTAIVLSYPSPLAHKSEYAPYSAGDVYQGVESFVFFASRADLTNPKLDTVPVDLAWTRVGPWLPWMQLRGAATRLVYVAAGHKVARYDDLPEKIRSFVRREGKEIFAHAPSQLSSGGNATSFRYFKDEIDAHRYRDECP